MKLRLRQVSQVVLRSGALFDLADRDAAIVAWLALEGPTPRAELATLMWPLVEASTARAALRQRIFQLRKQLGFDLIEGRTTLSLSAGVEHDLEGSTTVLGTRVLDFSEVFDTWLAEQRHKRNIHACERLTAMARKFEIDGQYDESLLFAEKVLALAPLSEAAHRQVIRLHYLRNDRSTALLAFDRCEQMLKDEIGVRPSSETLDLLKLLEVAEPSKGALQISGIPASILRPPRMIGREFERLELVRTIAGKGIALLIGEAGIGKSRLISSVVETSHADGLISICARPGDRLVPFALASRIVRPLLNRVTSQVQAKLRLELTHVLPEWSASSTDCGLPSTARLIAAVSGLISESVATGVRAVMIDDLQYADRASVELVHAIVGRGICGWVLAMRSGEIAESAKMLVDEFTGSHSTCVLRMRSLGPEDTADLLNSLSIDGIGGLNQATSLHRYTGGLPLYILETIKATWGHSGRSPLPDGAEAPRWIQAESVLRLIEQRLATLTPQALKLARCAAVAGPDLSSNLVANVLGLQPLDLVDAWVELESAHVLREASFSHDLIAEATLAGVPLAIAKPLHASIAVFLQQNGGDSSRIAEHWVDAGEVAKAVPYWMASGRRARIVWQCDEAARYFRRAGDFLLATGLRTEAFEAYFLVAETLSEGSLSGQLVELGEILNELATDDGQLAMASLVPVFLNLEEGKLIEAKGLLLDALPRAQRANLPDIETELLWSLSALNWELREIAEASQHALLGLKRLRDVDPATARLQLRGTRLKFTHLLGLIEAAMGRYQGATVQLESAYQLAMHDVEITTAIGIANALVFNAWTQGDSAMAVAWCNRARDEVELHGSAGINDAPRLANLALVQLSNGDFGNAFDTLHAAMETFTPHQNRHKITVLRRLHSLQFELGRTDLALKGFSELRAQVQQRPDDLAIIDTWILRMQGRGDSDKVMSAVANIEDFATRAQALCLLQRVCSPERILPLLVNCADAAHERGAFGLWMGLQSRRIAALEQTGQHSDAIEHAFALLERIDLGLIGVELFPYVGAELCKVFATDQQHLAEAVAKRVHSWMRRAASTLPTMWQRSYFGRAPVLQVLATTERILR